jgi:hypothetical protein
MLHVGLDLNRRRLDVCVLDGGGELVAETAALPDAVVAGDRRRPAVSNRTSDMTPPPARELEPRASRGGHVDGVALCKSTKRDASTKDVRRDSQPAWRLLRKAVCCPGR